MTNKNKLLIRFCLVVSLLLSPTALLAQTANGDWFTVRNLPTDTQVSVKLKTGKSIDGKIASVSDTSITLAGKKQGEIRREDVQSVHQLIKKSAMPATLIGAVVGAIAGGTLMFVIIAALHTDDIEQVQGITKGNIGLIKNLGMSLFKEYVVPFEISSILFLSAMVGAVIIGKKEKIPAS